MYAIEKFQPYLLCYKAVLYTNHSALKRFLEKKGVKPCLTLWILNIKDTTGDENVVADNLSLLIVESQDNPLNDVVPNKHLLPISLG